MSIGVCTSPRLRRHGSIRSSAGSLSSRESGSSAVFIPPSGNSKPISELSSIGTTKIPGRSNGQNRPTKSWPQWSASATKRSRHYAANFRFTWLAKSGSLPVYSDIGERVDRVYSDTGERVGPLEVSKLPHSHRHNLHLTLYVLVYRFYRLKDFIRSRKLPPNTIAAKWFDDLML